jgi:plasmid stabilization system protein ParE
MDDSTLNELAGKLFDAKRAEDAAKKVRIECEEAIAALVETPENGSKTVDAGDGLKVVVKRAIGYFADVEAIRGLDISEDILPVTLVPSSYTFNERAYESLRDVRPDLFAKIAKHVETKPRKVSVTLKLA